MRKNPLGYIVFLLMVLLLITNCEPNLKEDLQSQKATQTQFWFKKSFINQLDIERNKSLFRFLDDFKKSLAKNRVNKNSKTLYVSKYDFYIDTDSAQYIETRDGEKSFLHL